MQYEGGVPERALPGGGPPANAPPFRPSQAMQQMGSVAPRGVQPPLPFGLQQQQQQRQQLLIQQQFAMQQQQLIMQQQQVRFSLVDVLLLKIVCASKLCCCHRCAGFVGYVFQPHKGLQCSRLEPLSNGCLGRWSGHKSCFPGSGHTQRHTLLIKGCITLYRQCSRGGVGSNGRVG